MAGPFGPLKPREGLGPAEVPSQWICQSIQAVLQVARSPDQEVDQEVQPGSRDSPEPLRLREEELLTVVCVEERWPWNAWVGKYLCWIVWDCAKKGCWFAGLENWRDLIDANLQDDQVLQYELLRLLTAGCKDVKEAVYWVKKFNLDHEKIPYAVWTQLQSQEEVLDDVDHDGKTEMKIYFCK